MHDVNAFFYRTALFALPPPIFIVFRAHEKKFKGGKKQQEEMKAIKLLQSNLSRTDFLVYRARK
jgi:hypothetical protein